ncbi:hypothetical protein DSECCO2_79100 [anaerobic digester metagenome]|jgi:hypothetical protein
MSHGVECFSGMTIIKIYSIIRIIYPSRAGNRSQKFLIFHNGTLTGMGNHWDY